MLRFLVAIGLIMTSTLYQSIAFAGDDGMRFPSTIGGLNLFMRHVSPTGPRRGPPVLILHGATFPSGNAAGWKIDGRSWMDELASAGYDVYALDFLGSVSRNGVCQRAWSRRRLRCTGSDSCPTNPTRLRFRFLLFRANGTA